MTTFAAYTVALDLARALRPVIEQLKAHNRELADQLERASTSIVLNVAEGARRHGKDPVRFYWIASGSASEILAALDLASIWHRVDDSAVRPLLDRQRRLLWGLTHKREKRA